LLLEPSINPQRLFQRLEYSTLSVRQTTDVVCNRRNVKNRGSHRSYAYPIRALCYALPALLAVALGGVWFVRPGPALASDVSIVPVGLSLTPTRTTDLITLHNKGEAAVSLELSVFQWHESPDGKIKLTPSDDVVFFPPIVTVGPGEDRIVRVGAMVPFGLTEKTYRLIAEELPPPRFQPLPAGAPQKVVTKVVVLTRISMPIFLSAPSPSHAESIDGLAVQNGRLVFELKNNGNTHVLAGAPRISGWTAGNRALFNTASGTSGYLLAGEPLQDHMDLPNAPCSELQKIAVEVPITEPFGDYDLRTNTLKAEIPVSPADCGPARGSTAAANSP
jgi:fimbrial chaperone protein